MDASTDVAGHILILNWRDTSNPEGGGSEVYIERIAAQLIRYGYRVTLLCAAHNRALARESVGSGLNIIRRGGRHTVYLWAALIYLAGRLGAGPLAKRALGRPDLIVDVCNGVPFLSPLYASCPTLVLVHHVHREQWPVVLPPWAARIGWWLESRVAVRVYRRCRYITVSAYTRDELAVLGVKPDQITIVHNGTPEVVGGPVGKTAHPSLIVLGRLVPHKRVDYALHALAELAPRLPGLELTVAGQGWWQPRLEELAADLGIADRLRFTGFVSERRKHELLGSAWVVLVPSVKEGWGLSIVEAGARGTPAVAFHGAGGVAEAVVDGVTGLLADDRDDFTAKIGSLLTKQALRQEMAEAARAHARSFTWAAAGRRFAEVAAQVLADARDLGEQVTEYRRTPVASPDRYGSRGLRSWRR